MGTFQGTLRVRGLLTALIAALTVASCGGVDSGGTGAVAVGPVSGFGSIIVNGVRFDDSVASIKDDDGTPLTRDRLQLGVGSHVEASPPELVAGTLRSTASSIVLSSQLIGPVAAVDPTTRTLSVLGQAVSVTPATVFDLNFAMGLASVPVGATIEVYGRFDAANAHYTATRIEARSNATVYKVRGPIAAVDRTRATLMIGSLAIDYSQIPAADLPNVAVGNIVRARLQPVAQPVVVALALPSGVIPLPDGAATVEGRISAFVSSRMFSIDGTPVDGTAATFPQGEAGVALGARIAVQGTASTGTVNAQTVTVEGEEDSSNSHFELHGAIEALDTVAKTFSLRGVTVDYGGQVSFEGGNPSDLAVGKQVEVTGILSSDGTRIDAQEIDFDT